MSQQLLDHSSVDAVGTMLPLPSANDFRKDIPGIVCDATAILNDGTIHTKYTDFTYQYNTFVCGAYGPFLGLSLITPSREWAGGGYTKQDIDVHGIDTGEVNINWHLSTLHGGSSLADVPEGYSKTYGPVLWYFDDRGEPANPEDPKDDDGSIKQMLWGHAQEQSEAEKAKWPYKWISDEIDPEYKAENRSTVSGSFSVKNGTIMQNVENDITVPGTIGWAVLSDMRGDEWQKDNGYYVFYAPVNEDGSFEINNVRPGNYRLNINVNGVMGEYEQENIIVAHAEHVELGHIEWDDPVYGETLWTIGTPDRSGQEFFRGDPYRYFGAQIPFNNLFPNGVNYKVGESDWTQDWYFMHTASQTSGLMWHHNGSFYFDEDTQTVRYDDTRADPSFSYDSPGWRGNELAPYNIIFDSDKTYENGTCNLMVAMAGGRGSSLVVYVNGQKIEEISSISSGGAVPRNRILDIYSLTKIEFDAKLLKQGENTITLTHLKPAYQEDNRTQTSPGGMDVYFANIYDAIRLDISADPFIVEPDADKTLLNATIDSAKNLDEDNFTADSWAVLKQVLVEAQLVYITEHATQQQVDDAQDNLQAAINALVLKEDVPDIVNKTALNSVISMVKRLDINAYTSESWNALIQVLNQAISINEGDNATQQQVDDAQNNLQVAISNLVAKSTPPSPSDSNDDDDNDDRTPATVNQNHTSTPVLHKVTREQAISALASALSTAKAAEVNTATISMKNVESITLEALKALQDTGSGLQTLLVADTMAQGRVNVRISLDPSKSTQDIQLSGSTNNTRAVQTSKLFQKYFNNQVRVVSLSQQGSFGQTVKIAAKVDLSDINVNELVFYSYDYSTNTFTKIKAEYWIDQNSYIHFNTPIGGDIVISEGQLNS